MQFVTLNFEQTRMASILSFLPKELLVCIANEWLDESLKDACSLDVAIANRQLRATYILEQWFSTKEGFTRQIKIESNREWASVVRWKDKRGLDIKSISLDQCSEHHYLPHLALFFPYLKEIKLCLCDIPLHHIFFASLTQLRKLSIMHFSSIVVFEEIMQNSCPTAIEELHCSNIETINYYNNVGDEDTIPSSDVYLWIAKCCPNMKKIGIENCFEVDYVTVIHMVELWPQLKELLYEPTSLLEQPDEEEHVVTTKKVNLDRLELNYHEHESDHAKHFVDILCHCCNPQALTSLVLLVSELPVAYQQRLLQSIEQMNKVKDILLYVFQYADTSRLVDVVLTHCHALEALELIGPTNLPAITLYQTIATSTHHHLNNLRTLQLERVKITDETLAILCNSVYAKQLTTLCLKYLTNVSIAAYQKVFTSFTQLHSFVLYCSSRAIFRFPENVVNVENSEERIQKLYYEKLLTLLNPLFNNTNCAFANTLQALSVHTFCYNTSKWRDKGFKEAMICDHVVPHWKFAFPQLKSCSIHLNIGDVQIASLMLKRLLTNCSQLHSLNWNMMDHHHDRSIMYTAAEPEKIRRMREQQLFL